MTHATRGAMILGAAMTVALSGCTSPDGVTAASSAVDLSGGFAYVADGDNGAVARVNLATGDVESFVLGLEPARIARVGDRLFVTVRAEGAVVEVAETKGGMEIVQRVRVGGEPFGIVPSPDGQQLYVALSTGGQVVELDADTLSSGRKFTVPHQPRWLTMHPSGRSLFVACAREGALFRIDLREGAVERVDMPTIDRGDPESGEVQPTTPRITGDPVINPDGSALAVPGLFVDNHTSVGDADPLDDEDKPFEPGIEGGGGGYASGNPEGLTRFNPGVVTIPLSAAGVPSTQDSTAVLVSGRMSNELFDTGLAFEREVPPEEGIFDGETVESGDARRVRGYLSSLAFGPDGHTVFATIEGASAIAVVAAHPVQSGHPSRFGDDDDPFFGDGAFGPTPRILMEAPAGAQGVAIDPATGEGVVYGFLDRAVATFDADAASTRIGDMAVHGGFLGTEPTVTVAELPPSILPPDVLEGRRRFFSADDASMAAAGAGVSCATCHFDGNNDGLTWTFDHGVRQTPSLAGRVSTTAPITWTNDVASVEREVVITSQGRMGGHGLSELEALDVAAYIDWSREIIPPDVDEASAERGREIFMSAEAACGTCHSGERLTDNASYAMVDLSSVNTPTLRGLSATAPYFHDGRAHTLADVVDLADEVGMGHTSHLSDAQKADLVEYLRSL